MLFARALVGESDCGAVGVAAKQRLRPIVIAQRISNLQLLLRPYGRLHKTDNLVTARHKNLGNLGALDVPEDRHLRLLANHNALGVAQSCLRVSFDDALESLAVARRVLVANQCEIALD